MEFTNPNYCLGISTCGGCEPSCPANEAKPADREIGVADSLDVAKSKDVIGVPARCGLCKWWRHEDDPRNTKGYPICAGNGEQTGENGKPCLIYKEG